MNWLRLAALALLTGPFQDRDLGQLAVTARSVFEARDFTRLYRRSAAGPARITQSAGGSVGAGEIAAAALASMVR